MTTGAESAPKDGAAPGPEAAHRRRPLDGLRAFMRARELPLVAVAAVVGILSGLCVAAISGGAQLLHEALFGIAPGTRLSAAESLPWPLVLAVPALGGVVMGSLTFLINLWRRRAIVDPIEANALHGGRMSLGDSLIVAVQTTLSNGFGASLGQEAGYTQISAGLASRIGSFLNVRRNDLRTLVGCGAAGGIAAAFHAPLTGAFYGFELIIGVYSIVTLAPVMTAALAGYLTAGLLGLHAGIVTVPPLPNLGPGDYLPFLVLGLVAAGVAIAIMRLVTLVERLFSISRVPAVLRPVLGGIAVGLLALYSPQILASGHGALFVQVGAGLTASVAVVFVLKILASAISLGSGFRGGMFFASLFLGSLMGKLFAGLAAFWTPGLQVDPVAAAMVGMTALAVGVVGGPLTMSFLALELTADLTLTGIVLTASVVTSLTVREAFGYSFTTWRMHLRGETIRGAQDIGWMRALTVARMMRKDVRTFPAFATVDAFREAVPLGSTQRAVLVDEEGRYAGLVVVADAYAADDPAAAVGTLARQQEDMLLPAMNVKEAALAFDRTASEELAVVDDPARRRVLGVLTESHTLRRYAEELDKVRRGVLGEG